MPGPAPKPAALRQRRNHTSTAATLSLTQADIIDIWPELPARSGRGHHWRTETLARWATVGASAMVQEYLMADLPGLIALAMLWDDFYRVKTPRERSQLAAEIRQQEQRFGLSPIDRRRLQWEGIR